MSIGKYLTNPGVLGALIGALGTAKQAQHMPKDWRRVVIWGVWAAGLALALAGAAKQQEDEEFARELKLTEREAKQLAKARRARRA